MNNQLIVIMGPTAVGKTSLGITLAKKYNGEVVNGDSLQVYKKLDIGTAKVTKEEMDGVPHHLIDIVEVDDPFTASDFKIAAEKAIADIQSRGKTPILVGGSGLYIQGLIENLSFGNAGEDRVLRKQLEEELKRTSPEEMWQKLASMDAEAAQNIHPNNSRRVIRALEAISVSGKKFSEQNSKFSENTYDVLLISLNCDRALLYERINYRVELMVDQGVLKEAQMLFERMNHDQNQAHKGIGYKEWFPYFEGRMSFEDALATVQQNSRRYAKRQLTWFRNRMSNVHWFDVTAEGYLSSVFDLVSEFLNEKGR